MSEGDDRGAESVAELIDLERSQIGHDIHDLLIPLVFAASAELEPLIHRRDGAAALSEQDQRRVLTSQGRLSEALDLARRLLTQIYPPELEQTGWLFAAKDAVGRIVGDTEIVWKVDAECPLLAADLNRDLASASFRILIQAVRNAVAHGDGDTIAVRALKERLVIVDDGNGFDPTSVPTDRFGLKSMHGRATLIGKRLEIDSQPGGPTSITLWLS
ncbi:MAG: ATP-binding protein [Planctomycetota bacterium]